MDFKANSLFCMHADSSKIQQIDNTEINLKVSIKKINYKTNYIYSLSILLR